jgi:hypothetical protein
LLQGRRFRHFTTEYSGLLAEICHAGERFGAALVLQRKQGGTPAANLFRRADA